MHKPENSPFVLKSSDATFLQRQKNVFDQLNSLQTTLKNNTVEDMETDQPPVAKKSKRSALRQFRGKESIFKRPQDPISKRYLRSIPDFKKNPHKWKKYSLEDVKDEHMSETCNTKAALSFLDELKKRNSTEVAEKAHDEQERIVFKKVYKHVQEDDEQTKASFRSSKVIMPEYVVGKKVAKERKHGGPKSSTASQLKLDHLYDED